MHAGLAPDEHYLAKPDSGSSTDHMCSQTVETNVYIGVAQPLRDHFCLYELTSNGNQGLQEGLLA